MNLLRQLAPWIWMGTCGFGMFVSARLAFFALQARRKLEAHRESDEYQTLTYLFRLANTAFVLLVALIFIGALSVIRPRGDDLTGFVALIVLLLTPLVVTWIVYRAFWLRFGHRG